jgi:hypothetical protein
VWEAFCRAQGPGTDYLNSAAKRAALRSLP